MIISEKIYNNIDNFDIFPSHKPIFDSILNNIDKNKRIVLRGVLLSGKSFFCQKLMMKIKERLNLSDKEAIIIDLPFQILNEMNKQELKQISINFINNFLDKNDLNDLIKIKNYKVMILDDINDILFRDLPKFKYELNDNQILIQVLENKLYQNNKNPLQKLGYKIYELVPPNEIDLKKMIERYNNTFSSKVSSIDINFNKFKSKIT